MASAADPGLRWGRPKTASAPPWRSQQSQQSQTNEAETPPWRRRKEVRTEPQVAMQQGGSSASDSRPLPLEEKASQLNAASRGAEARAEAPPPADPPASPASPAVPAPPAPPAPSAPSAATPKDDSRVFDIGEKVRYWSGTHAKWVEAHVQRINRGPDGDLISYDLTAKANADISRVKDASTAEDAPPPVAPARVPPEASEEKAEKASTEKFEKGAEVQYFSETRERWIDATVEERHEKDGSVMYDLNCKKGVPAERLRSSNVQYTVGEQVEYWSATSHRWMPAFVEQLHLEAKTCDLSIKPGAPLSRVRKAPGSAVPQFFKAARATISHGVGVPPPPLACSFKGGDQVQYYSETKHKWMETTVIRIFELDGNICYDLDCKKGVFADKVRSSLRASQERYEVGEAVEYWSVSAGRWLSAKVTKARLDIGQCDLDIKLAAPIGRLRRAQAHAPGAAAPASEFVKPSPPQIDLPNLPDLPDPPRSPQSPHVQSEDRAAAPFAPSASFVPQVPMPAVPAVPAVPAAPAVPVVPAVPAVPAPPPLPLPPTTSPPASPRRAPEQAPEPPETPEPEMEPTEPNKDIEMKPPPLMRTVPSLPSPVLSVSKLAFSAAQPKAFAAPEPVQRHLPRPLPQPKHSQVAKQDPAAPSQNETLAAKPLDEKDGKPEAEKVETLEKVEKVEVDKAKKVEKVENVEKVEKVEKPEYRVEREETPEEEVDYDDDENDVGEDDDEDEKLEEHSKDETKDVSDGETGNEKKEDIQTEVEPNNKTEAKSPGPEEPHVQVVEKHKKSRRRHKSNDGHEKERRRRRRKHKTDKNGPETGAQELPRPDANTANGAERGRRRRRHAPEAQNKGHGYSMEPSAEMEQQGRRHRTAGTSPGAELPAKDELPRATTWNSDRGGFRRAPPGATAKALPRPSQRDVRDRDSRGVCDLIGSAQDGIDMDMWKRLAVEQEQAMERDKGDGRQKHRRSASASPLKRKRPLLRRNVEGRDVRLISREPARRHRSRSRHRSRGHRR